MPATKIINVLKNDNFEDIFDLFKNTESEEIIFIFPRGSKFAKEEQYFQAIKNEAEQTGKNVSVMSADPIIAKLAADYGFSLLVDERESISKKQQPETLASAEVNEDAPEITLAASGSRTIKDILKPAESERSVKIREETNKAFEVGIRNFQEKKQPDSDDDIAKVWTSRHKEAKESFYIPKPNLKFIKKFRKTPTVMLGGAIVILLLIIYGTLGNAKITIYPKKQNLNFQLRISASTAANAVSPDFNKIPGQRFSDTEEESGIFPATGKQNIVQKANGQITIYNKSLYPQHLVATTRFKTPDGLIFRIPQTIIVPAGVKTGSIIQDGSVVSPVYADKAGSEYNIPPSKFTIPGFEGTPKADDFYAKSEKPMSGGIVGMSKTVTEEDFTKAQETLTSKLREKIIKSLKNQAGELKVIDLASIKFESPVSNAKTGSGAENLQMSIKGSASVIAFREQDIMELVKNYVSKNSELESLPGIFSLEYSSSQNNSDNTTMTFTANASGKAIAKVNTDKISREILGMREADIRIYFKNIKEIESARIILSPFWVTSIPKDSKKVRITLDKS